MCGILGYWKKNNDLDNDYIIKSMIESLKHRGPDNRGIWIDKSSNLYLGHARLSIIDLSDDANQPLVSEDKSYVLTFNGELYNYKELREDLISKNIKFQTESDTEVVLKSCMYYGVYEAVKLFNGMFSFCFRDIGKDCLYIVRDRIGIKPLYYSMQKNMFIFSSELKGLMSHPDYNKEIDNIGLSNFLKFSYIPRERSIFKNTWKLLPGEIIKVSSDFTIEKNKYWDIKQKSIESLKNPLNINYKEYENQLTLKLKEAVKKRLVSDVPIGAFLSGGIDSSLISAMMQELSINSIKTFSMGFEDSHFNEAPYAKKISEILKTDHTEMFCTAEDAKKLIFSIPKYYDEPFADSSQIPTMLLCENTKKHVTVTLSGDGGDELFAGYDRYYWMEKLKKYKSNQLLEDFIFNFLNKTYRFLNKKLKNKHMIMMNLKNIEKYYDKYKELYFYNPMTVVNLYDTKIVNSEIFDFNFITDKELLNIYTDRVEWMQLIDQLGYLTEDILHKVDRASMSCALETRVPILDHEVVEYSWKIPKKYKIKKNNGKIILKNILSKYIPRNLIDRPKHGFSIPMNQWLTNDLKSWVENLINDNSFYEDGLLNKDGVLNLWKNYLTGMAGHTQGSLWAILMYLQWKSYYKI